MFTIKHVERQLELLEKFKKNHHWTEVDEILYDLDFCEDEYSEIIEDSDDWNTHKQKIKKKIINIMNQKGLIIDCC